MPIYYTTTYIAPGEVFLGSVFKMSSSMLIEFDTEMEAVCGAPVIDPPYAVDCMVIPPGTFIPRKWLYKWMSTKEMLEKIGIAARGGTCVN